jgi:hypothetical protein
MHKPVTHEQSPTCVVMTYWRGRAGTPPRRPPVPGRCLSPLAAAAVSKLAKRPRSGPAWTSTDSAKIMSSEEDGLPDPLLRDLRLDDGDSR